MQAAKIKDFFKSNIIIIFLFRLPFCFFVLQPGREPFRRRCNFLVVPALIIMQDFRMPAGAVGGRAARYFVKFKCSSAHPAVGAVFRSSPSACQHPCLSSRKS